MQSISTVEMERIPIIDLCASPNKIREQIKRSKPLVLTDNDDPVAVMIHVNASTVEDTMRELRFLQMRTAIKAIQEASVRSGLSGDDLGGNKCRD